MKNSRKAESKTNEEYRPVVTSQPRELRSLEDLKRPNPYLNDWTQIAAKAAKKTL